MHTLRKSPLLAALGFLWVLGILGLYYVSHKPFTPELALQVVSRAWVLAAVGLLTALAGGLGFRLAPRLPLPPLAALSLQAALGFGLLALGVLAVGQIPGALRWALWTAVPVGAWLLRCDLRAWLAQAAGMKALWLRSDGWSRWVGGLLGFLFFCALLTALAPPLKYDALMYHLTLPHIYLEQGRVGYVPELVMSGMPQTAEMLYTWAAALAGSSAGPVLSVTAALLAVLGLVGWLEERLEPRAAWAGAAALLAGYTLAVSPAWGYVDWLALWFGAAALIALDAWRRLGEARLLRLAGAFAGLALGTKYPAGVLGLVCLLALGWEILRGRARFWPVLRQFGLPAVGLALPWLVKNLLTTGNPLYPFFFGGGAMSAVRMSVYQGMSSWGNWQDFWLLPLRATYIGVDGAGGYSVSVGPLLLGLGALAWMGRGSLRADQRTTLGSAAFLSLAGLLVWTLGNRLSGYLIQTRFYYALFPAFAALAAFGFAGLSRARLGTVGLRRVAGAVVLLALGLNAVEVGLHTVKSGALRTVLGLHSTEAYLADNLGWYAPVMADVRQLGPQTRTLLLFEPRSFYCRPNCAPDEILDRWKRSLTTFGSPQAVLAAWKAEGFTHLLVYRAGVEFMRESGDPHVTPAEWAALEAFLADLPEPVNYDNVYWMYDLRP